MICEYCGEKIKKDDHYWYICNYDICRECKDSFVLEREFTNNEE
jgi:hypothetical protein